MRIIAGKDRGRKLFDCSKLKSLRPTTDSNRESLFNILGSSKALREIDFELDGVDVLDVFCGSGAISFEALSRGARSATLIDNNYTHLQIAKENAAILKSQNIDFVQMDALKITPFSKRKYGFIFIDPPYGKDMEIKTLEGLNNVQLIKDKALIVIECSRESELDARLDLEKFILLDKRKYGISVFYFLTIK